MILRKSSKHKQKPELLALTSSRPGHWPDSGGEEVQAGLPAGEAGQAQDHSPHLWQGGGGMTSPARSWPGSWEPQRGLQHGELKQYQGMRLAWNIIIIYSKMVLSKKILEGHFAYNIVCVSIVWIAIQCPDKVLSAILQQHMAFWLIIWFIIMKILDNHAASCIKMMLIN